LAHCPFEKLRDVAPVLKEVRGWEGIREPKPGIFYYKAKPFLHFHEKDGERWADVRDGADWGRPLDLAFGAGAALQKRFLAAVKKRYEKTRS
jgi:hypothetical protein